MKGLNLEALDYFIRVLEFYNFYIPRNKTIRILGAAFYFISFTFLIRSGKVFLRKQPSKKIETVYRMIIHKGEALATVNPERFFIDSQFMVKVFIRYGVQNSNYALGLLSSYSVFFSWLGFFFKTANKNLELCNRLAISKETISWLQYKFAVKMFDYFSGKWQEDPEYEYTYNLGIQKGAVWELTIYLLYTGFIFAEKGNITKSLFVASKLFEASDYFENSHARAQGYRLKSYSYLKFRKLKDVIIVTTEGIHYTGKTNHIAMLQVLHCHKCIAFSLLNESEEAVKNLLEAEKLVQQSKIVKIYICEYLLAKCHYEIALLRKEQSLNQTKWNKLLKTNDLLIRKARTVPSIQMEAYRLRAIVCWLINKQRKAFLCLDKSLELAQRLDAKPELARTCFETGKCLMDPKSKRKILRSKNGSEYLLKARSLFEELDLQWDLREYEKYMEG